MVVNDKRLTILVDMDDTIEGLVDAWVRWLNTYNGTSVQRNDITDWEITSFFPQLTAEEVYAPLEVNDFWKTVRPFEDAQKYLQRLISDGHKVFIVTASDYRTLPSKMENVLFKYFPMFTWNDVIITSHKQLVKGDVLVDDGVHNLLGGDYEKLLMDAPHNRSFDAEKNGMKRVMNWQEAYTQICEISKK